MLIILGLEEVIVTRHGPLPVKKSLKLKMPFPVLKDLLMDNLLYTNIALRIGRKNI